MKRAVAWIRTQPVSSLCYGMLCILLVWLALSARAMAESISNALDLVVLPLR